jgi:O-acetylhomoserine (thiol)-lyase
VARIGEACAQRGLLYFVDNTMTSPWLFKPKSVGAGLVINALTKYIGGHGNALGGSITDTGLFDWTRYPNIQPPYKVPNPKLWGITQVRKKGLRDLGGTLSAEQAHHLAVGAETLALRLSRQCENARLLAAFLERQPAVRRVHYPGLASHSQHAIAREHFRDYGALLAFELDPARDVFDFLDRLEVVVLSSNLGDNRTLAIPVAHTIFWELGPARRAEMGIADSLVRVSVGIEDRDDLIADFAQALGTQGPESRR